jgi:hypothetical protein
MVKKTTKATKAGRRHRTKSSRRHLRRRTMKHKHLPKNLKKMGGYSPIGPNGGDYGKVPDSYPSQQTGALPAPMNPKGVPIGKEIY